MSAYLLVKTLHILSSTILFGTGIGFAYFFLRSHCSKNLHGKYFASHNTVIADYLFTLPAVIIQPLSGLWLVKHGGFNWLDAWLVTSYVLFAVATACWLPVVWIQIQMKNLVSNSLQQGTELPESYTRLFRLWMALGIPAFLALITVFFLMVSKPT